MRIRRRIAGVAAVAVLAVACGSGETDSVVAASEAPSTLATAEGELSPTSTSIVGRGEATRVALECGSEAEIDVVEWRGLGDMFDSVSQAVAYGLALLAPGLVDHEEPLTGGDGWEVWGVHIDDGTLIAAVTVIKAEGGWEFATGEVCRWPVTEADPAPLTLYVSNQSFDDPNVSITVTIDGEVVVDEDFFVDDQHNRVRFTPTVGPGDHTLVASAGNGVELTVEFSTDDGAPLWAVLDYWFYNEEPPGRSTFGTDDEPVGFA